MRAILVVCCVLLAWPAWAETVSFTNGRGYFRGEMWTLPKFDPRLGTLTGVSVDVSHEISDRGEPSSSGFVIHDNEPFVMNFGVAVEIACCGRLASANATVAPTELKIFGGTQTSPGVFSIPANVGGFRIDWPYMASLSWTGLPASQPLDFYIASAMADMIEVDAFAVEDIFRDHQEVMAFHFEMVSVSTLTTVNYEFTPVSEVPVPAAFWLLISGLLALVPFVRRSVSAP